MSQMLKSFLVGKVFHPFDHFGHPFLHPVWQNARLLQKMAALCPVPSLSFAPCHCHSGFPQLLLLRMERCAFPGRTQLYVLAPFLREGVNSTQKCYFYRQPCAFSCHLRDSVIIAVSPPPPPQNQHPKRGLENYYLFVHTLLSKVSERALLQGTYMLGEIVIPWQDGGFVKSKTPGWLAGWL